jgi:hypothetical protein
MRLARDENALVRMKMKTNESASDLTPFPTLLPIPILYIPHSWLFFIAAVLELVSGAAIYEQGKGSGRLPGEFKFDPLGLGKDAKNFERYRVSRTSFVVSLCVSPFLYLGLVEISRWLCPFRYRHHRHIDQHL